MTASTAKQVRLKPQAQSRVTNGSSLGNEIDGRSVWARRLRDLIAAYSSDVSSNPDLIPEVTRSLIRRAATMTVELERAEAGFAAKGSTTSAELTAYGQTANTLRRHLESLRIHPLVPIKEAAEVARVIEGGRYVKDIADSMGPVDKAVCYGADGITEIPVVTKGKERWPIARQIAFASALATSSGKPLDPEFAQALVDMGLVRYAEEDGDDD